MRPLASRFAIGVALSAGLCVVLSLAGCKGNLLGGGETSADKEVAKPAARPAGGAVENQYGTPVKDRVATLGIINKRNNLVQDIVLKSGEQRTVGNVVVKLATCEKTAPWESQQETGAFVQVFVQERARVSDPLAWHKVFSGWLFKNSPSLNVVEHPVYDVWVKDCAMKFPGEEESPEDFKAAVKASKAAGNDKPADAAPPPPTLPAGNEDNGGEAPSPN
jgi:hypothetical protein